MSGGRGKHVATRQNTIVERQARLGAGEGMPATSGRRARGHTSQATATEVERVAQVASSATPTPTTPKGRASQRSSVVAPPLTQMSMSFEPTATAHIAPPVRRTAPMRETPTQPHAMTAAEAHPPAPALHRPRPVADPVEAKRAGRPGTGRQQLSELRAALADGWEIVQPIFARPLWSATDDSTTAFNFVLRRDRTTRLLIVPEGRTVERLIRDRQLMVDYRRSG